MALRERLCSVATNGDVGEEATAKPSRARPPPPPGSARLAIGGGVETELTTEVQTPSGVAQSHRSSNHKTVCHHLLHSTNSRSSKRLLLPLLLACIIIIQLAQARSTDIQASNELTSTTAPTTIAENQLRTTRSTLIDLFSKLLTKTKAEETTSPLPTTTSIYEEEENELTGAANDDDNAEGCKGLSAHESAETKNISDTQRLVNLQSCIQEKVKAKLMGATRSGMEVFEKLSLSGGCTSSLMSLMTSLGQIKSFAFKFLDASAKVPSGMLYGLLSDFGDFDQCLSIRSNPQVLPEQEAEEGAYSGKYCLMNIKSRYHVDLAPNVTVPDGIIPDGVLWDDLVKNYWTSKSPKGFQVGMCLPSRCTDDDLNQLYQYVAESYNVHGEIISCQDSLFVKQQRTPNLVQRCIICTFYLLLAATFAGTIIGRYFPQLAEEDSGRQYCCSNSSAFAFRVLVCFSIAKNWTTYTQLDYPGRFTRRSLNSRASDKVNVRSSIMGHLSEYHRTRTMSSEMVNMGNGEQSSKLSQQLTVEIQSEDGSQVEKVKIRNAQTGGDGSLDTSLRHLSGLRLLVIFWITIGHSFLYPSANNYQHYRSIINMNITRNSVWFATTNFTLGIDMLLYMTGLVFVYKLAQATSGLQQRNLGLAKQKLSSLRLDDGQLNGCCGIVRLMMEKILRFWPTYLTVIALAIVVPLSGDGPMWPEMVAKRIGASCQRNWWANILFINNFQKESEICLPSSWFVSNLMQLFLIGSLVILVYRRYSFKITLITLLALLAISTTYTFVFAFLFQVRAPVIRMDESFVMEMDENIWRLYINIFSNLGPFIVGMAGGFILLKSRSKSMDRELDRFNYTEQPCLNVNEMPSKKTSISPRSNNKSENVKENTKAWLLEIVVACLVALIAFLVLSSVFHDSYSPLWSCIYWSLHRVGWAIVTGYLVHNCATGQWKLLNDLLSLSTFIPFSRLIFIAYLVYPIFIHMHSGLVRDGLHVSIYNMLNIYTTRLVMTFTTALLIHLLVELPLCSIEDLYLNRLLWKIHTPTTQKNNTVLSKEESAKVNPLLAVAPVVSLQMYSQSNPQATAKEDKKNEPTNEKVDDEGDKEEVK